MLKSRVAHTLPNAGDPPCWMPVQIVYVRYTFLSRSARVNRIALGNTLTTPIELRTTSSFSPRRHVHISAAGSGHRQRMQGWFSQIIIGIIVTVVGTVIANSIVRGPGGRHFMSGVHFSGPTRR